MDEASIAAAIMSGPDAIIAADGEGVVTFWNAGAQRIFGFTADEAVGRSLDLIIPERLRARHWQGWNKVLATGQSRYGAGDLLSVPALRSDGKTISVEFTFHPLRDEVRGEMCGFAAARRHRQIRGDQAVAPTTGGRALAVTPKLE